jgi:hypothetical protein
LCNSGREFFYAGVKEFREIREFREFMEFMWGREFMEVRGGRP